MFNERLEAAARRVLEGDESVQAANAVEQVLIEDYAGDERFEELHDALALYSPFERPPYVQAPELRERLSQAFLHLDNGSERRA